MVYPALLPLMRTPRPPVVDWTDAPADSNGLVRFAERRNLVSARVPSHFSWPLQLMRRFIMQFFFSQLDISLSLLNRNTFHTTTFSDIFNLFFSQLSYNVTTQGCRDFLKIPVHAVKTYRPKGRRGVVLLVFNHSTRWRWDYLRENLRYLMSEPQSRSRRFWEEKRRTVHSLACSPYRLRYFGCSKNSRATSKFWALKTMASVP